VGTWELTRELGYVRQLTVLASNVSSGLGGIFTFEFGEDGVSALISEVRDIDDFETVRDFDLINAGAYYRAQFEPSRILAGGEMVFITTTLRRSYDGPFVRLGNQEIEEQNAAMGQQFAYLKGFKSDGKSISMRANEAGNLIFADFYMEVEKGNVPGHSLVIQTGHNPDIDTAATETVWMSGGTYTPPSAAAVVAITVNVLDIALGLSIVINGLSAAGVVQEETVVLNGIAELSSMEFLAINYAYLVGSTAPSNDITMLIGGTVIGVTSAGFNRTQNGYYHVPADKVAYLIEVTGSSFNNTASARLIQLNVRDPGSGLFQRRANFGGHSQGGPQDSDFRAPFEFSAGSVIRFDASVGANNTVIDVVFGILLVDA